MATRKLAPAPGRTVPGTKKPPLAGRREAFPWPLFPGDPGDKPRLYYQGAPFGVPPPLTFGGGTKAKLGRTSAARMRKLGCLTLWIENALPFPGRDAARSSCEAPLRRGRTVPDAGVRYGPGSAAHRCAVRCVRGTRGEKRAQLSSLICASRITGPHLSISDCRKAASSAGV